MGLRLGIDVGGTFTDFALLDPASGDLAIHKTLTTPDDPSRAVLAGAAEILDRQGIGFERLDAIVHGTTLVTNALIERRGARTGMLVTRGFGDLLDIGKEHRYDLFDLRLRFPEPVVSRTSRREIDERVHYHGGIEREIDLDEVRAAVADLVRSEAIEALAVCFLHSYANPAHERRAGTAIARDFPELHVSLSAEVAPFMREYERWTTTTVNAYAQPMVERYLRRLENGLGELGFAGRLHIMNSSGGTVVPEMAGRFPVRLMESGPAAGVLMSAHLSRRPAAGPTCWRSIWAAPPPKAPLSGTIGRFAATRSRWRACTPSSGAAACRSRSRRSI
jgi:N-methylhydantoinase A